MKRIVTMLLALTLILGLMPAAALAVDNGQNVILKDYWNGIPNGSISPIEKVVTVNGWIDPMIEFPEDYDVYVAEFSKPTDIALSFHDYEDANTNYSVGVSITPVAMDDNYLLDFDQFNWDTWSFDLGSVECETGKTVKLSEGAYEVRVSVNASGKNFSGFNGATSSWYSFYIVNKTAAPKTVGGFTDVQPGTYFADPVLWAVEKHITEGTSATTFSPDKTCTRAQIITFLWRAAGSPEPKKAASFTDVADDTYYAKACAWAAEKKMVEGSTFAPNDSCTRAMAVEFMWKQAGSPKAAASSFSDVAADSTYAPAVAWAVKNKVTDGTSATTFSPDKTCTRAQIVTLLYRALAK